MLKISTTAIVATFAGILLASSATSVQASGFERIFSFTSQKERKKAKKKRRNRSFNFFGIFSDNPRNRERIPIRKAKIKSKIYTYRANRLVSLGNNRLKQPANQIIPLFSGEGPKNFDPAANLHKSTKLDDSLAQTIFDTLVSPDLSTKVTKDQKSAIVAFYKARNFKSVWTDMEGVLPTGSQLIAYFSKADEDGLKSSDYLPEGLTGFGNDLYDVESDLDSLARLDINLTAMAVRYGQHASGGRIIPNRLSGYHDLKPPIVAGQTILAGISKTGHPEKFLTSLHPTHKSYAAFKQALAQLNSGEQEKQYPKIRTGRLIKLHHSDERVKLIRERLLDSGLLEKLPEPADNTDQIQSDADFYDERLFVAVKEFQKSKGLRADGIIGSRTLAAFNGRKKVNKRNKLVMNMERLRWLPRKFGEKHVFVNQASFKLDVTRNNRQVWQTRVVVGKPKHQTSFFIDKVETVVFNPYWGVPQSIITNEMLPRLQSNPGYLDQKGFEVYNSRGRRVRSSSIDWYNYGGSRVPFSVRQPPSGRNALGKIKFLFPNKHAIYLHDTPSKHLFERSTRAYSHGCVRVKDPFKLAENILGWQRSRIDNKIAAGKNASVRLKQTVPVYITYFTAWADPDGKINYYSDIYGRDRRLDKALNLITVASN